MGPGPLGGDSCLPCKAASHLSLGASTSLTNCSPQTTFTGSCSWVSRATQSVVGLVFLGGKMFQQGKQSLSFQDLWETDFMHSGSLSVHTSTKHTNSNKFFFWFLVFRFLFQILVFISWSPVLLLQLDILSILLLGLLPQFCVLFSSIVQVPVLASLCSLHHVSFILSQSSMCLEFTTHPFTCPQLAIHPGVSIFHSNLLLIFCLLPPAHQQFAARWLGG